MYFRQKTSENEFEFKKIPIDPLLAYTILKKLDGKKSLSMIADELKNENVTLGDIGDLVLELQQLGLAIKNDTKDLVSGITALFKIEDRQNELLYDKLYKNIFWQKCKEPSSVPVDVFIGMGIENYHFLYRSSWFDSPALTYQGSESVRKIMNTFYREEHAHDEIILKSLNAAGISKEDLNKTVPLPETIALCNCLAYWSANDPLFFFSTLGVLEGKDLAVDTYVASMEKSEIMDPAFIKYIKNHSLINLNEKHGNVGREIFLELPLLSLSEVNRLLAQTNVFVDIYDRFYTSVWEHYSRNGLSSRRI